MSKEITYAACLEFQQAKEALSNDSFHAFTEMVNSNKHWKVLFKRNGELNNIKVGLTKVRATKLAEALNAALNK